MHDLWCCEHVCSTINVLQGSISSTSKDAATSAVSSRHEHRERGALGSLSAWTCWLLLRLLLSVNQVISTWHALD
jgi:hypothetical protein